jgi:DUF4097 and DUF4098 domain-containing protein YvlB
MDFDGWYAISSRSVCVFPSFRPCNRTGKTSNGAVECYDRKVDLEIKTSNGGIRLERFQGSVVANTSNGKIEVIESQGTMSLKSSNGKISLK